MKGLSCCFPDSDSKDIMSLNKISQIIFFLCNKSAKIFFEQTAVLVLKAHGDFHRCAFDYLCAVE